MDVTRKKWHNITLTLLSSFSVFRSHPTALLSAFSTPPLISTRPHQTSTTSRWPLPWCPFPSSQPHCTCSTSLRSCIPSHHSSPCSCYRHSSSSSSARSTSNPFRWPICLPLIFPGSVPSCTVLSAPSPYREVCSNSVPSLNIHGLPLHTYFKPPWEPSLSGWATLSMNHFWINIPWALWWFLILYSPWYSQQIWYSPHEEYYSLFSTAQSDFYSSTQSPWISTHTPLSHLTPASSSPGTQSTFSSNLTAAWKVHLGDAHSCSRGSSRAGLPWGLLCLFKGAHFITFPYSGQSHSWHFRPSWNSWLSLTHKPHTSSKSAKSQSWPSNFPSSVIYSCP